MQFQWRTEFGPPLSLVEILGFSLDGRDSAEALIEDLRAAFSDPEYPSREFAAGLSLTLDGRYFIKLTVAAMAAVPFWERLADYYGDDAQQRNIFSCVVDEFTDLFDPSVTEDTRRRGFELARGTTGTPVDGDHFRAVRELISTSTGVEWTDPFLVTAVETSLVQLATARAELARELESLGLIAWTRNAD